jgi:hypothetical protein
VTTTVYVPGILAFKLAPKLVPPPGICHVNSAPLALDEAVSCTELMTQVITGLLGVIDAVGTVVFSATVACAVEVQLFAGLVTVTV